MEKGLITVNKEAFHTEEAYKQALEVVDRIKKELTLQQIADEACIKYYIADLNVLLFKNKTDKVCAGSIQLNGWTKRENNIPYESYVNYSLDLNKDPEVGDILFYGMDKTDLYEITKVKKDSCLGISVSYKPFQLNQTVKSSKNSILNWLKRK